MIEAAVEVVVGQHVLGVGEGERQLLMSEIVVGVGCAGCVGGIFSEPYVGDEADFREDRQLVLS